MRIHGIFNEELYIYLFEITKPSKKHLMTAQIIVRQRLALSLLLILFLFSIGCQHGDENPVIASYRIIEMRIHDGDDRSDIFYHRYKGEKLSEVVGVSSYFQDSTRSTFDYPDENTIIYTDLNPHQKIECSYLDGKMTQWLYSSYTDSSWATSRKYTYEYNNGNLIEEIQYSDFFTGQLEPYMRITYEYEGNNVLKSNWYINNFSSSTWQETGKEEAIYQGNLMTKVIYYDYVDSSYVANYYFDLQYAGSFLTGYFAYVDSTNELMVSYTFTYDDNGNLVTQESTESGGTRWEYLYEAGKGNFQQIIQPGGGLSLHAGFPQPLKLALPSRIRY